MTTATLQTPTHVKKIKVAASPAATPSPKAQELNYQTLGTVALAQIRCESGRTEENVERCLKAIEEAKQSGASCVVFPELTIPGYCSMDLAHNRGFLRQNREAVNRIREASNGITIIVGFYDQDLTRTAPGDKPWIYNAAAVIQNGEITETVYKTLLPNYGIFYEKRYTQPAPTHKVVNISGVNVGVAICEDLWAADNNVDIAGELVKGGAEMIISLNASPFNEGKLERRIEVISEVPKRHNVPVLYAAMVGSYDGYDGQISFDGKSFAINEKGSLIALGSGFHEDLVLINLKKQKSLSLPASQNIVDIHDALVLGVKDFFRRQNCQRAYLGLSGGIDSAVVAALAVEALGAENVIGVTMPSHITSSETKSDAYLLATQLGIKCIERPIGPEYEAWLSEFRRANNGEPKSITKQNKQARIRGAILMEYTNEDRGSLLLNTGNKCEVALGYFTLYGDSCGALSVLADVDKGNVYELARFINRSRGREIIPQTTIDRPPSAELEPGQTDAANLPADYHILTPLIDRIIEEDTPYHSLIQMYPQAVVDRTLDGIRNNEGKRRQLPPGIRVTKRAFGEERRIPMDHRYLEW